MAYDEIHPCPDCGELAYDRCPSCGWDRPTASTWPFWCFVAVVGFAAVAIKLAI